MLGVSETAAGDDAGVYELVALFQNARTYGSLIQIPESLLANIVALKERLEGLQGRNFVESAAREFLVEAFLPILRQTELLGTRYDVVAANPPYMGTKGMNPSLKAFAAKHYPDSKSDLFAMFMERCLAFAVPRGLMAMINMQSWMFLSSYERLRSKLLSNTTILSMAHLGERAFDSIGGAVVSTTAFVIENGHSADHAGTFIRLVDGVSEAKKESQLREAIHNPDCNWLYSASADDFEKIPNSPISYWVSSAVKRVFSAGKFLSSDNAVCAGHQTGDNDLFLRQWFEVEYSSIAFDCKSIEEAKKSLKKWFPHKKGGEFRKWYGNHDYLINWENDGSEIRRHQSSALRNPQKMFLEGVTWSHTSSGKFSPRYSPMGFTFNVEGPTLIGPRTESYLALMASKPASKLIQIAGETLHFLVGNVANIPEPVSSNWKDLSQPLVLSLLALARSDWDDYETSWDFTTLPVLSPGHRADTLEESYTNLLAHWRGMTDEMRRLEEDNNRIFIDAYGLQGEIDADVPLEEISLTCNPAYRYGVKVPEAQREELLRADTMREFISYAAGCMLGRYSLDEPGLILANQGDTLDDYLAKVPNPSFMPDADNIIPMLDDNWFEDDVTDRFLEFLKVTFGPKHFDENLAFIENAIGKDIRKFFKRDFFADHLKRYKRRPIYWVFSSGKEKAFEAIVYMHRYNETTLARMRMNYVVPLQSQMANRIERLATELSSPNLQSSERKRKDKQQAKLVKQLEELGRFEEELRHLADQRIQIDLDDGVKVNYGKFGNLLADVKKVTGEGSD